jgi:hypothetical protein
VPGKPVVIRPEPNAAPIFDLKDGFSGMEIAASYVRVIGLEIGQRAASPRGYCVVVTRPVAGLDLMDLHLHHCSTGIRLSQTGSSAVDVSLQDIVITDQDRYGIHCSPGPCDNVSMRRIKLERIGSEATRTNAAAMIFDTTSTRVTLEDSEVAEITGDGIVLRGTDATVNNTVIRNVANVPISFAKGGSLLNTEIRSSGQGVVLRGGSLYRVRGNFIEGVSQSGRGYPLQVAYDAENADRIGTLYLAANRIASADGNVGLPAVTGGVSAPLLTVMQSNTFYFQKPEDGVELPNDFFASSTAFGSATGTGLLNLGGNISVAAAPYGSDLQSPISSGGRLGLEAFAPPNIVFPGALIKGSGAAVYLFGADGKRHAFPNEATYRSWYGVGGQSDFSGVVVIADEAMSQIALGKNVTYRPGLRLVKVTTDPKVYAVASGVELRWVKTEAVAKTLFGANWAKQVDDIPDTFFVNYQVSDPIETEADYSPSHERESVVNPAELY